MNPDEPVGDELDADPVPGAAPLDDDAASEDEASAHDDPSGPVDQLGIPMNREPTIDDVRSDGEAHRQLAMGCSVLITLLVVAFWLVRGYLL